MEILSKCLLLVAFAATTYGRSVLREGSNLDSYENATDCSCRDSRYLKHYEAKGCVATKSDDACDCPQKFICPNRTQAPTKGCVYQNKEYKVGSKIATSDACQVCRCRGGASPQISCVTKECTTYPPSEPGESCHLVYKENICCPVGLECIQHNSRDSSENKRNETCEYNGKIYPFGSKIYPEDDPCQICICEENWNGVDNSSCYEQNCMFEKNKSKLNAGCIPVYHEKKCCPIEFYCPSSHNISNSELPNNESLDRNNSSNDNYCHFAGQYYELGEELLIGNPCVKCRCSVPPDFTCVHQTCPRPPNEAFCYRVYNPEECCPSYECMLGEAPIPVPEGCPTPLCSDSSCLIEIPPGHECPTCVCSENISELEHNNLEQQVQQISQNIEQIGQHMPQVFEPISNGEDYSEEALQVMPLQMQDPHQPSPVMEKMVLPESENSNQYDEGLKELEENSNEANSSIEAAYSTSEKVLFSERENVTLLPESELNDTLPELDLNHTEKSVHRRSEIPFPAFPVVQDTVIHQEINEDIEREGGILDGGGESFEGELQSFKKKLFDKNKIIIDERSTVDHTVEVPPGCPTPMCEGPWCRIGILDGHNCPTCICKRFPVDSEP